MILYYNGSAANYGYEAIGRATRKLLDDCLTLASFYPEWDQGCDLKIMKNVIFNTVSDLLIQRR